MDAKRVAGIILCCAACLFGFLISTAFYSTGQVEQIPYWLKGHRLSGTITSLNEERIEIEYDINNEEKATRSFAINKLTKITLTGDIALKEGTFVKITFKKLNRPDDLSIAKWIIELKKPDIPRHHSPSGKGEPDDKKTDKDSTHKDDETKIKLPDEHASPQSQEKENLKNKNAPPHESDDEKSSIDEKPHSPGEGKESVPGKDSGKDGPPAGGDKKEKTSSTEKKKNPRPSSL